MRNLLLSLFLTLTVTSFSQSNNGDRSIGNTTVDYYLSIPNVNPYPYFYPTHSYYVNNNQITLDRTGYFYFVVTGIGFTTLSLTKFSGHPVNNIMLTTGIGLSIVGISGLVSKKK
jgi:hypothetical protein